MNGKRIVGYFADWSIYGRNFFPWQINVGALTHIQYAFTKIGSDGLAQFIDNWADTDIRWTNQGDSWNDPAGRVYGCINQLFKLKKANRHLKTALSFGGWTLSKNFSTIAANQASRQAFVASAVTMMLHHGFDGIDIDWEYPCVDTGQGNVVSPQDGVNFTFLLQEFRNQLSALGGSKPWLLSVAVSADPGKLAFLEIQKLSNLLDYVNLMSYDYQGSWSSETGHQSNLYPSTGSPFSTDGAVNYLLSKGMDSTKIVVGYPAYGRGWTGVTNANNGLGQRFTGISTGTWEQGMYDYKDIMNRLVPAGYQIFWDATAQQSYLWSASKQEMVTFDDVNAVKAKANYVNQKNLGGLMTWELSADMPIDSNTNLLNAAKAALNGFDNSLNQL